MSPLAQSATLDIKFLYIGLPFFHCVVYQVEGGGGYGDDREAATRELLDFCREVYAAYFATVEAQITGSIWKLEKAVGAAVAPACPVDLAPDCLRAGGVALARAFAIAPAAGDEKPPHY